MRADKIREIDSDELRRQLAENREQAFRLRFQLSMGQTDGLKKVRVIRKDQARIHTILREREPGIRHLALARLAAKLRNEFVDLDRAGRTDRVTLGEKPPRGVDGNPAPKRRGTALHQRPTFSKVADS